MRLLLALLLIAACKGDKGDKATGSGSSAAVSATVSPEVAALPGELWFVEDKPHTLVRLAAGKRLAIEAPLFPSSSRLPDGRLIAIASKGDGSPDAEQLVLVAADGARTPLGPTASQVRDPIADPTGAWVIAALQHEGRTELHRIEVASGAATKLTDNKEGNFHPVLLGADAITFVSSRDGDSEIYRSDSKGGAVKRLTAFHKDDWDPTPLPGGMLAFTSDREGPPRLFVMKADGTGLRRLTDRAEPDVAEGQLAVSPNGKSIAYVLEGVGRADVVVRALSGGKERIITPRGARDADPTFSPDGRWLIASRTDGSDVALWAHPIAGGDPVRVTSRAARLPRWF